MIAKVVFIAALVLVLTACSNTTTPDQLSPATKRLPSRRHQLPMARRSVLKRQRCSQVEQRSPNQIHAGPHRQWRTCDHGHIPRQFRP